jgi:hypothetical protein
LLVDFTDSNWVGDLDDWNFIVGYVFSLGYKPFTWDCKKQCVLTLSFVEVEYQTIISASQETLRLWQILLEFGFQQQHSTTLWCDNESTIQLAKDLVERHRNKHIEPHIHFIIEILQDWILKVLYCPTNDQVANISQNLLQKQSFPNFNLC